MNGHFVIPLLSPIWYWGLALSVVYIGVVLYLRRFLADTARDRVPQILGIVLAAFFLMSQYYYWFISDFGGRYNALPLQLCDIAQVICVVALIARKQLAFEFAMMLGMPAAMHSLATPEMTHGYSAYLLFDYYFSHSTQVLAPLVLIFYAGMRPRIHSWWRVFAVVNVILVVVFVIDWQIGANYIYLMEKPSVENPLLIGPWPYYIIAVEIAGLLHILLFYFIFRKVRLFSPSIRTATA